MKKRLLRIAAALLLCCILSACQQVAPYEVLLLKPSETPETLQNTDLADHSPIPETPKDAARSEEPLRQSETPAPLEASPESTPTPAQASPPPSPISEREAEKHFFVQQETKEVQALFRHIYSAILEHRITIELPPNTSRETTERAIWLLTHDCPELFWFSHISEFAYMKDSADIILQVTAKYLMDEAEANKAKEKIVSLVEDWKTKTEGLSDYEKELFVHDALVNGCRYSDATEHDGTIYGALILGKARCLGYAEALCYAMRSMEIPCVVLTGEASQDGSTESHAWNLLKIDGTWTLNDPTWNDPAGREICMYAYFNVTDAMLSLNHTLDEVYDRFSLPACSSTKQNHSVRNGCYIAAGSDTAQVLTDWGIAYLNKEKDPLTLRFETAEQYKEAMGLLSQCLQEAVNQTGKMPEGGSFYYFQEPDSNYLQFE